MQVSKPGRHPDKGADVVMTGLAHLGVQVGNPCEGNELGISTI